MLLDGAREAPYAHQVYVTLSLKNAKRLVWPALKRLNREYNLGGKPNDSEGYMRFPDLQGEPHIFLGGMKDAEEIEKIRGIEGGVKRFVIDEAQSARPSILRELIDDVIEPSLFDYDGELTVIGTPGPVPAGYFYDIDVGKERDGWDHFFWSLRQNPWLAKKSGKSTDVMIAELLARRKWSEEHPTFRREYLGEWVNDPDALVFKWNAQRNGIDALPDFTTGGWRFVIGVDLGFSDADAIAVLGWRQHDDSVYLVAEYVRPKQGMTALMDELKKHVARWKPIKVVMDLGGLATKAVEDFRSQFQLPLHAADKNRKLDHIELLNDAMLTGRFKALRDSRMGQDSMLVQWDADKLAKGERKVARLPHSDIADAVLYAYMETRAHFEKPAPPPARNEHVRRLYEEQRRRERSADPYGSLFGVDD